MKTVIDMISRTDSPGIARLRIASNAFEHARMSAGRYRSSGSPDLTGAYEDQCPPARLGVIPAVKTRSAAPLRDDVTPLRGRHAGVWETRSSTVALDKLHDPLRRPHGPIVIL